MKEKVLILVHNLAIGGVSTSLVNVSRLLANHGCDVTIKTTAAIADPEVLERLDERIKVEILDERRFPILEKLPYFRNFFESGMWTRRNNAEKVYYHFVRKDERNKYDVEIAFYFGRPVKAICGSINVKAKRILWLRLGFLDQGNYAGFATKESAIEGFMSFDRIIAVSEDLAEDFVNNTRIPREKVTAIHNFLDRENIDRCMLEPCELRKTKFTIACVCRLAPIKNLKTLLNVVKRLQNEGFECACWLVGDGPERTKLEDYVQEYQVKDVTFVGFTRNPHKYVNAADLYVFPSLLEGYPNTLADSLYIGTPVVSTRCIGAPNILEDGKYGILTDFDEVSIYQNVRKMMTEPETYLYYKTLLSRREFLDKEDKIAEKLLDAIVR